MNIYIKVMSMAVGFAVSAGAAAKELDVKVVDLKGKVAEHVIYKGLKAIHLKSGSFRLGGIKLKNGTIRYKVAMGSDRGFTGLRFHSNDKGTGEEFYIRHHQSGNADATQYNPVYNFNSAWQLYHGEQYAVPFVFEHNQWVQVELRIKDERVDILLGDNEMTLAVPALKQGIKSGDIYFYSNMSTAYIADIHIEDTTPELTGTPVPYAALPEHAITEWRISNAFDGAVLGTGDLPADLVQARTWQKASVEEKAIVNLAQYGGGATKLKNSKFAAVTITSDTDRLVSLTVGYSDIGRVYLNGVFLYQGDGKFRSRDYRYLGTVGLFDTVPLRLKAGKNDLVIAVSERFGGWGVLATLEKMPGIALSAD